MTTRIYFHPDLLLHDPLPMPGFAPARIEVLRTALAQIDDVEWCEAEPVDFETLQLVHTPEYIEDILQPIAPGGARQFDPLTYAMPHTAQAALRSAGLVAAATKAALAGEIRRAFCFASPGGHHAEAEMAQGYCFFNNVALAGALAHPKRVAVLDFDAHHGNGTQSLFWSHENRLLVSLHEDIGLSGFADERGAHDNILNIPLPNGSGGAVLHTAMMDQALPKLINFAPDLLLVSAGFDMHRADPLANLNLEVEDYAWIGKQLAQFPAPIVAVMEGGYNLEILGECAAAFISGLTHG